MDWVFPDNRATLTQVVYHGLFPDAAEDGFNVQWSYRDWGKTLIGFVSMKHSRTVPENFALEFYRLYPPKPGNATFLGAVSIFRLKETRMSGLVDDMPTMPLLPINSVLTEQHTGDITYEYTTVQSIRKTDEELKIEASKVTKRIREQLP